jgi:putative ABC transport system permease protein
LTLTYLHTVLQLGALYAIVAIAVCVSFRFLSFPDITVDGSFVTGAVITARLLATGAPWPAATVLSVAAGVLAGAATATTHQVLGINKFFSGILVMMMLYSVNLRILGGANLSVLRQETLFALLAQSDIERSIACLVLMTICVIVALVTFHTWLGLRLRALGCNPSALSAGVATQWLLSVLGLGFSNGLAALAGSVLCQYQRFADVNMGFGVTISGFAGLFLGETFFVAVGSVVSVCGSSRLKDWLQSRTSAWAVRGEVFSAALGAMVLLALTTSTLYLGLPPSDLRFVSAFFLIVGMLLRRHGFSYLLVPPGPFER